MKGSLSIAPNDWSVARMRRETPGCGRVLHLNNAGCSLPCRDVIRTTEAFYRQEATYGGYESLERYGQQERRVYGQLGQLLNCRSDEIAILPSATTAWQQVVFGIPWQRDDMICTTPNEYGSNYINFLQLQSRFGVRIRVLPERSDGSLDLDRIDDILSRERPKLLSLTHIPTSSGAVYDAIGVGQITKAYGIPYLLDACQSTGQIPVDVQSIQCDFLSGTSRKFLRGPRGVGFLYASQAAQAWHEPAFMDVRGATWNAAGDYSPQPDAGRYEQYELNFAAKVGFGVAVAYCLGIGIEWIAHRIQHLAERLRHGLKQLPNVHLHDHCPQLCGIVSFTIDGFDAASVCSFLRERNINVSISKRTSTRLKFEHMDLEAILRASVHYFNTEEEIETFLAALVELLF